MRNQKSFTLIELLVVIAIIGLIASIVLVSTTGVQSKAKITKMLEFSQSVQHSLGAYAVGVWSFDEGSGTTALDGSGYGNNGTLTNFVSPNGYIDDTPHKVIGRGTGRYALSFDGVNDYVNLPNSANINPGTGSLTVEGWVFAKDYTYPKTRFPIGGNWATLPNKTWNIDGSYDSTGIRIRFADGTNGVNATLVSDVGYRPEDTKNKWTHIVVVFDRTAGRVHGYVNGVKQSGSVDISSVTGDVQALTNFRISDIASWMLDGLIDEVRIYEKALILGEIQQHYAEGLERHKDLVVK